MKRITDPTFKYVPAAKQNLAATFRRVRREMEEAAKQQAEVVARRVIGGKK
jgi:hypothetical protein